MTLEWLPEVGCFSATHPLFPASRCRTALDDARAFFALPQETKNALSIERSPHFRGYSRMFNDRDWREQIHFGREEAPGGLRGPNLWPPDEAWRSRVLDLLRDLEHAARNILATICLKLGMPPLMSESESPYVLLKMIHYMPRAGSGVAPHVDFSWITLLLHDDPGLEVLVQDRWVPVRPGEGTLLVNIGELLEFATGGELQSTPHRVSSGNSPRVSMPFFLNPALDTVVSRARSTTNLRPYYAGHVHRVFSKLPDDPFVFGEAEWRRKGLGIWCEECVSPPQSAGRTAASRDM